jgi:outer membrane lipoprotein SlyB
MKTLKLIPLCGTVLLLAACASTPMGPTVRALPAQGKPFEVFQAEQASCKQYAAEQVQGQADRANSTGVLEGVGGTVLGAGLGAALGGGHGAAVGAGLGAVGGTAVGANTSAHEQRGIQQQYNDAYVQCMVAKGNQVQQPVIYAPPPTTVIYTQPAPPPTVIYAAPPPPPPPPPPMGYAPPPY